MQSHEGNRLVMNDGDQHNSKKHMGPVELAHEEGKRNAHLGNDAKDQRTLSNRLAKEEKAVQEERKSMHDLPSRRSDPTAPAILHGNRPSRGARIDKGIEEEEREELERKGRA